MPMFEYYDPQEIRTEAMLRHEASHLVLAYYYGFRISQFRFIWIGDEWGGSVRNDANQAFQAADPIGAAHAKARQLLIGEIAARRFAGLPTDRVVMSINVPGGIRPDTPLHHLTPPSQRAAWQDSFRVLDIARHLNYQNWWPWFWTMHNEARAALNDNWGLIETLAKRFAVAKPYETTRERILGRLVNCSSYIPLIGKLVWKRGSGIITGDDLISCCRKIGVPIRDSAFRSMSYD